MNRQLLEELKKITPEERAILDGQTVVQRDLYTSQAEFVVDSHKLLQKGRLIEIRPHTRFVHFPRHRHNYVELVYMCGGSTTHIIDGETRLTLEEGDLLFLNQSVYHEILPAGETDLAVNFILLPAFFSRGLSMIEEENLLRDFLLSTLSGENTMARYLHIRAKGILPIENILESMIDTLLHQPHGTNTLNQISMGLLFLSLSRFASFINRCAPGQWEQNTVFSILQYIETHYRGGTLAEICAGLNQPAYTVSRLLKKHTGMSFKQLLQQRKLQQAAYLLVNTTMTVEAIMEAIGYDNSSYFHHRFREKYGCTPRAYRQASSFPPAAAKALDIHP